MVGRSAESHFEDDPESRPEGDEAMCDTGLEEAQGERKEEPGDFYLCPLDYKLPAMSSSLVILHPCSKLSTTHPL